MEKITGRKDSVITWSKCEYNLTLEGKGRSTIGNKNSSIEMQAPGLIDTIEKG